MKNLRQISQVQVSKTIDASVSKSLTKSAMIGQGGRGVEQSLEREALMLSMATRKETHEPPPMQTPLLRGPSLEREIDDLMGW